MTEEEYHSIYDEFRDRESEKIKDGWSYGFFVGWFLAGLVTLVAVRMIYEITRHYVGDVIDWVGMVFLIGNFVYLFWRVFKKGSL